MQTIHPASAERMGANINRDNAAQLSPEFCAMPRLLTQKDLAEYVHKSTAWCERARWAGEGPRFVKLGRHVRYRADDVLAWIEQCSRSSTSEGAA